MKRIDEDNIYDSSQAPILNTFLVHLPDLSIEQWKQLYEEFIIIPGNLRLIRLQDRFGEYIRIMQLKEVYNANLITIFNIFMKIRKSLFCIHES